MITPRVIKASTTITMKVFILASLLVVAVSASLEERASQFQAFKLKHSKTYSNQVEETQRFAIFNQNVADIEAHNELYEQGLVTYKQGINQFADWTKDEFKAYLTLHKMPEPSVNATRYVKKGIQIPSSVDWRNEGYVTPVKNQGDCGSCWAFSVTGTVEGAYYKKTGDLVSLSEQQLVDCTTDFNYGCDGGWMEQTLPYIQQYGVQAESTYAYTARDGTCKYDASKIVTKISSTVQFYGDESTLEEATATIGPISIAMDANYIGYYSSGIFSDAQCTTWDLNHGVLIVGYGTENGQDYWIVKNSWGADWGENGYFRIVRGTNECGVIENDNYAIIN